MGMLNHLFGDKKDIAKELAVDEKKRMPLWQQHLSTLELRERLCSHFNYASMQKPEWSFEETLKTLDQIEASISLDIITIKDEEKNEKEIMADLERLKSPSDIYNLSNSIVHEKNKEASMIQLFHEIHDTLKTEFHLIKHIKKKPSNAKDLLLRLLRLIRHNESNLYGVFNKNRYYQENAHIHEIVTDLTKAVILQKKWEEKKETAEQIFAKEVFKKMSQPQSKNTYRKLGEAIFFELAERAGAPMPKGEDITEGIRKMERFIDDDKIMQSLIKKLRPKYDKSTIDIVIAAFRNCYSSLHFEDLEGEFVT